MEREVQVRQAARVAGISGEADRVAGDNRLADRDEYSVQREMRIQRDSAVLMRDGNKVGVIPITITCAILRMNNNAGTSSRDHSADRHREVVAI